MQHKLLIGITVLGAMVVLFTAVLEWVIMPTVIDSKITDKTQLVPDSETWKKWSNVSYPIYLSFHVFHVTNPDEFEGGKKPIFEERGPYVYRQTRVKVNISQEDSEDPLDTVQYNETKTYFFEPTLSNGTERDLVNVVNIPFVGVVHKVQNKVPVLTDTIANLFLAPEKVIRRNVSVGELLFKGFNVTLYTNNPVLQLQLPADFSNGTYGVYKTKNGTASKRYNIYTGVGGHEEFGIIKTYDGKSELGFWTPNTSCDLVKGSDGSLHPPFLTKDRKIDVFSSDLCRSLAFTFTEETTVKDIKTYRFTLDKQALEDPRINVENQCYCLARRLHNCPRAGVISLEGCRNGAPVVMSAPYFMGGYEGYLNDSNLPKADPEKHLTYLDIEPRSGVLLRAHKRIQVNIKIQADPEVKAYANLTKDILFPLLWADEFVEMDDNNTENFKAKLIRPMKIVDVTGYVFIGIGSALFVIGCVLYVIQQRLSQEKEPE